MNDDGFIPDDGFVPDSVQELPREPSGAKKLFSDFVVHPLIEGTGVAAGALGAGTLAAPAGPIAAGVAGVAGGAAMLPPSRRAAEAVDRWIGVEPPPPQSMGRELMEGAMMETGGRAMNAVAPVIKPLFRGAAKKMASLGQTVSGAPAQDLMMAYDKGLSVYTAPGMKKAGRLFDEAARKAGAKSEPALEAILDPQLTQARQTALEVGTKLRSGQPITAQEALSARQAVDRIKAGTSWKDRKTLHALENLRGEFQNAVAQLSPELKEASRIYRNAKVRNTLLKPIRINKSGDPSALVPILGQVAGALGTALTSNPAALAATTAGVLGTSPLAAGAAATASGGVARGISRLFASPVASRAVAAAVTPKPKFLTEEKAREYLRQTKGDKVAARELAKKEGWTF